MKLQIKTDVLRVHGEPNTQSAILFRLQRGDVVESVRSEHDFPNSASWSFITTSDNRSGWIADVFKGEILAEAVVDQVIPSGSDVYFIRHRDGQRGVGWERRLPPYPGFPRRLVYESIPTRFKPQVVLSDDDMDFIDMTNMRDKHKLNWLLRRDGTRGALLKTKKHKGKTVVLFPQIDFSGNYRRVLEFKGDWARVSSLQSSGLPPANDAQYLNPQTAPEWFARIYCVDSRGRVQDTPQGIVYFPTMISFDGHDIWLPKDCLMPVKA